MRKKLIMLLLAITFQAYMQCATQIDYSQEYPSLAEGFQLLNIANFNGFAQKYSKNKDIQNQAIKRINQMLSREFFSTISQDIATNRDVSPLLNYVIRYKNDFLQDNVLTIMQQENKINDLKLQAQQANAHTITSLLHQLLNEESEQSSNDDASSQGDNNYNDDDEYEYKYEYSSEDDSTVSHKVPRYDEKAKFYQALADSLRDNNSSTNVLPQDVNSNLDSFNEVRSADEVVVDKLMDDNYLPYQHSDGNDDDENFARGIANSLK